MRIQVKVIPNSSQEKIEKLFDGNFKVWVTKSPEKGKANKAVEKVLADYFNVRKSSVEIIAGKTARDKLVEIEK